MTAPKMAWHPKSHLSVKGWVSQWPQVFLPCHCRQVTWDPCALPSPLETRGRGYKMLSSLPFPRWQAGTPCLRNTGKHLSNSEFCFQIPGDRLTSPCPASSAMRLMSCWPPCWLLAHPCESTSRNTSHSNVLGVVSLPMWGPVWLVVALN